MSAALRLSLSSDGPSLEIVARADVDLDDTFRAWDVETARPVKVNGWLFRVESSEPVDDVPTSILRHI